jgi:hypothetical protein
VLHTAIYTLQHFSILSNHQSMRGGTPRSPSPALRKTTRRDSSFEQSRLGGLESLLHAQAVIWAELKCTAALVYQPSCRSRTPCEHLTCRYGSTLLKQHEPLRYPIVKERVVVSAILKPILSGGAGPKGKTRPTQRCIDTRLVWLRGWSAYKIRQRANYPPFLSFSYEWKD